MAMMVLGIFVFMLDTIPYQELQHQQGWRYPSTSRVGRRPARQFLGPDDETITLSGVLLPELTGGRLSLDVVEAMAGQGCAWPLIDGSGVIYGTFVIESLNRTKTVFFSDGAPRRIEFQLTLKRVDNDLVDRLANLATNVLGTFW
jgi:phage protein U